MDPWGFLNILFRDLFLCSGQVGPALVLRSSRFMWSSLKPSLFCFLCVYVCVGVTLCDPVDCNPPGSSLHGILQARILEWIAISFSRGIFPTQGLNPGLLHCRQMLYPLSHQGSPGVCFLGIREFLLGIPCLSGPVWKLTLEGKPS